jgi:hypothetical protein
MTRCLDVWTLMCDVLAAATPPPPPPPPALPGRCRRHRVVDPPDEPPPRPNNSEARVIREQIAALLRADPGQTDVAVARQIGCGAATVHRVRRALGISPTQGRGTTSTATTKGEPACTA